MLCADYNDKAEKKVPHCPFRRTVMKAVVDLTAVLLVVLTLLLGTCALTGCASTQNRGSSDSQTMSDFIGGGKPEFNGNKY